MSGLQDQKPNHKGGRRRPLPSLLIRPWVGTADREYLDAVLARELFPYEELAVPKRAGGRRIIHSPEPELMSVQRHVLDTLLNRIAPHPAAFAYRCGVSVVDAARPHLGAEVVVRLDVANFFPSIRERHVFEALLAHEWQNPVAPPSQAPATDRVKRLRAYQLALLLTASPPDTGSWANRGTGLLHLDGQSWGRRYPYRRQREGFLPQGAPTSGALSNLVMRNADDSIYRAATDLRLRYSRYSDDMYFSSRRPIDHRVVDALIASVRKALEPLDLHLNAGKTRVARGGSRRTVLGILVDGQTPRLPHEVHRQIDLHLRGADRLGLAAHARNRGFTSVEKLTDHVGGLISWVRDVEPLRGATHLKHWDRTIERSRTPIPSPDSDAFAVPDDVASPEQQARESIDRLLADGRAYRQSKDYSEFISFLGRFRQYSPFNAAMVSLQKPGARFVATDRVWEAEYRRVLRPGAQPLVIMQPRGPYMVVFDVSDTEALPGAPRLPADVTEPLAATSQLDIETLGRLWQATVDNAIREGFRVTLVDTAPAHAGSVSWSKRQGTISRPGPRAGSPVETYELIHEIKVSQKLSPLDAYVTLVHELAHVFCGHLGTPDPKRWPSRIGSKPRNEVEAESIAYIVLSRLDPTFKMGDYLLGYLSSNEQLPEGVGLRQMIQVASQIIEMGKARLRGTVELASAETLF